jgi:hypothetical protein
MSDTFGDLRALTAVLIAATLGRLVDEERLRGPVVRKHLMSGGPTIWQVRWK